MEAYGIIGGLSMSDVVFADGSDSIDENYERPHRSLSNCRYGPLFHTRRYTNSVSDCSPSVTTLRRVPHKL